jgi:hypothetical protein
MSEQDRPPRGDTKSDADQTLLGVAPPRIDSSADSPQRSPVFVRSGTSDAGVEPAPLPRMALPHRPPAPLSSASLPPPGGNPNAASGVRAKVEPALRYWRGHPVLGMALVPVLFSLGSIALVRHGATPARRIALPNSAATTEAAAASSSTPGAAPETPTLAELEARPAGSLNAREVVLLAEGHAEQKRAAASALRQKLEQAPALGQDAATQNQLLHLAEDPATAVDSLTAMAHLTGTAGPDLLYEVWTGTQTRTDATELARALLYSTDVRPHASAALAVVLDLRVAETCEQYQSVLPKALTDGDRRAVHLLTKLSAKRGCGPKKTVDCYACLRAEPDELTATINAVKSRRAPSFANP